MGKKVTFNDYVVHSKQWKFIYYNLINLSVVNLLTKKSMFIGNEIYEKLDIIYDWTHVFWNTGS